VAENQKSASTGCYAGGGWDASRSKEGPRDAKHGPSLRLAVLPEELGGREGQCQAFRNTRLQQNSVSTVANALVIQMANATFVSRGSDGAIDKTFSFFLALPATDVFQHM